MTNFVNSLPCCPFFLVNSLPCCPLSAELKMFKQKLIFCMSQAELLINVKICWESNKGVYDKRRTFTTKREDLLRSESALFHQKQP